MPCVWGSSDAGAETLASRSVQVLDSENLSGAGHAKRARVGAHFSGLPSNGGARAPYNFANRSSVQTDGASGPARGRLGTGRTMVLCAEQRPKALVMDRPVPADAPSGRVHHRRPQRKDLSPPLDQTAGGLQAQSVI